MDPVTLAAIALGGLFLTRKKKRRSSGSSSGGTTAGFGNEWADMGPEDRRAVLNEIRAMAYFVSERYGMMPYLADYLSAVGYWESRFNPWSANPQIEDDPYNAARGLFQMRPKTAFKDKNGLTHLREYPDTLYSIRWSFVAAVDDIARAARAPERKGTGIANWLGVRRWWRYPHLVHDFNEDDSESAGVRERLEEAIDRVNDQYGLNIDPDFIWMPVEQQNYPGIEMLMYDFGLNPNNPYAAVA